MQTSSFRTLIKLRTLGLPLPYPLPSRRGFEPRVRKNSTACNWEKESQRENLVEASSGSNSVKGIGSTQSKTTAKPVAKPRSTLIPTAQKPGGWGSWGNSLLSHLAYVVTETPPPQPPLVKPNVKDPPRGFTPSRPSESQPTRFGMLNKPTLGVDGAGDRKSTRLNSRHRR